MESVKKKIDDKKKPHFFLFLLGGLLVINLFIWSVIFGQESDILTVAFLDVGQGDAIYIRAPNGNQALIDAGINKKVLRELSKVIPFYDRSIDMVLATHPDKDHIGGLPDILQRYDVDFVMDSGKEGESATYKELTRLIEEKDINKNIKNIKDFFFLVTHIISVNGVKIVTKAKNEEELLQH